MQRNTYLGRVGIKETTKRPIAYSQFASPTFNKIPSPPKPNKAMRNRHKVQIACDLLEMASEPGLGWGYLEQVGAVE